MPIPKDRFAIIVGSMKCGTTSLFNWLVEAPEVCGARWKEPEWFSDDEKAYIGERMPERYDDLWAFDPDRHEWALEASTGYSKWRPRDPQSHERIAAAGLEPRVIYLVRNPFDRILSHWTYMQGNLDFDYGLLDDLLVRTSDYAHFAGRYASTFGRDAVLLLEFDDLRRSPLAVANAARRHLGLPTVDRLVDETPRNVTGAVPGRAERYLKRALAPLLGALPEAALDPVRPAVRRLRRRKRPAFTPSERAQIREILGPGMERLERDWGMDVSRWGF